MKNISILVEWSDGETLCSYESNADKWSSKAEEQFSQLCSKAASGQMNYIKLKMGESWTYIPKELLIKSAITVRIF